MSDFDVIVGGGGPAGATAAAFCAQRGLRVALFEHARFPRHKVCGDVINPNCWPVLERLGVAGKSARCRITRLMARSSPPRIQPGHHHSPASGDRRHPPQSL
jgi:flavin-dependent dehydrogenase